MRRITGILLVLLLAVTASGQNQPGNTTNGKTPAADGAKTDTKPAGTEDTAGDKIEKLPEGYANLTWGTYLSEAKDKISGRLTYTDDKTVIISKENELEYYYGFFYKTPETAEKGAEQPEDKTGMADTGKKVTILELDGQSIYVNGNDVLAFEETVHWDIKMMKRIAGFMSGGLFNVLLEGKGMVAITTHYDPRTL